MTKNTVVEGIQYAITFGVFVYRRFRSIVAHAYRKPTEQVIVERWVEVVSRSYGKMYESIDR